jgi:hypothetical protein
MDYTELVTWLQFGIDAMSSAPLWHAVGSIRGEEGKLGPLGGPIPGDSVQCSPLLKPHGLFARSHAPVPVLFVSLTVNGVAPLLLEPFTNVIYTFASGLGGPRPHLVTAPTRDRTRAKGKASTAVYRITISRLFFCPLDPLLSTFFPRPELTAQHASSTCS